jgi:hypothetical protein
MTFYYINSNKHLESLLDVYGLNSYNVPISFPMTAREKKFKNIYYNDYFYSYEKFSVRSMTFLRRKLPLGVIVGVGSLIGSIKFIEYIENKKKTKLFY